VRVEKFNPSSAAVPGGIRRPRTRHNLRPSADH